MIPERDVVRSGVRKNIVKCVFWGYVFRSLADYDSQLDLVIGKMLDNRLHHLGDVNWCARADYGGRGFVEQNREPETHLTLVMLEQV